MGIRSIKTVSANDQLTLVKKEISKTLHELKDPKCFELPRSLSMDRISLKNPIASSESVAAVINGSKSLNELSQHIKHVSNPTSIFTPDPFSKLATTTSASQTINDQKEVVASNDFSTQTAKEDNVYTRPSCTKNIGIQADLPSQTSNHVAHPVDIMADMQLKIDNLEKDIIKLSKNETNDSSSITKECINPELENLKCKLRTAESEIKSLNEQNRIISIENQKLIVNMTHKKENVTKEREVLYGFIHDFVVDKTINDHSFSKTLVDQMSKNLYSLIEHCNDSMQLNRMKDMFLSFRDAIVQIVKESIHLDQRLSELANSSNMIRIESEKVITQLEEKSMALIKENQDLQQMINDLRLDRIPKPQDGNDMAVDSTQKCGSPDAKNEISSRADSSKSQEQETIKRLKSEIEELNRKLLSFKQEAPVYPLSDLYEKIVSLVNRDASSGFNIKEILEWIEEKRVVIEELEKLRSSYSNLSYKHKHLVKEYSDQKSTMDEIQKRIMIKESEWHSKFKEFSSNANQLESRHSTLESILCDYAVQFQGVVSLASDSADTSKSDHPLPFLKYFGSLHKSNASLDHSLQHASSALSESQRVTNHALQNLDLKNSQIANLEKEKQEIQTLISKFKSEISAKDKDISAVKSQNIQLQERNHKLSDKLGRIADAFKWTMI